jgi:hypothetical protein
MLQFLLSDFDSLCEFSDFELDRFGWWIMICLAIHVADTRC